MFMENFTKDIVGDEVVYSMKTSTELFEALEVYHLEGYKLAAGYSAKTHMYYMTLLR